MIHHPLGLRRRIGRTDNEVRVQDVIKTDLFHASIHDPHIGIICRDFHLETNRQVGNSAPDGSVTDDADRCSSQLPAQHHRVANLPFLVQAISDVKSTPERDDEPKSHFGHCLVIPGAAAHYENAGVRGGLNIDVANVDRAAHVDRQIWQLLEHLRRAGRQSVGYDDIDVPGRFDQPVSEQWLIGSINPDPGELLELPHRLQTVEVVQKIVVMRDQYFDQVDLPFQRRFFQERSGAVRSS